MLLTWREFPYADDPKAPLDPKVDPPKDPLPGAARMMF